MGKSKCNPKYNYKWKKWLKCNGGYEKSHLHFKKYKVGATTEKEDPWPVWTQKEKS